MNLLKEENLLNTGNAVLNSDKIIALKKMKLLATMLFVMMFIIFIITSIYETGIPALSFLKAFSEAAMVGALADWFAVVALFKHPFGLPIPHTAIIPQNKNNIGKSLAGFIEMHFLTEKVIKEKIQSSNPSKSVAVWMAKESNRKMILGYIKSFIPEIFIILQNNDIKEFLIKNLKENLKSIKFSKLLQNILELLTENNQHEKWIKIVIGEVKNIINKNKNVIKEKVQEQTPWWTFGLIDDKIYKKIISNIHDFIEDFELNRDNKFRIELNEKIAKLIKDLSDDKKLIKKIEDYKNNIIENKELTKFIASFIENLSNKLNDDINSDNSEILNLIDKAIKRFSENLQENEEIQEKINFYILEFAVKFISANSKKICSVITDKIEKWDKEEISQELEIQIGKDLQFIRINGTLVGGIVGLGIFIIHKFIT